MKKTVSLILSALIVLTLAVGCAGGSAKEIPVHVEGSIFGGSVGDSIPLQLRFDPEWITRGDNTTYSRDLVAFSALIAADTYFRPKDLEKGKQNRVLADGADSGKYDQTVLLSSLGFSDVRFIESYKTGNYDVDTNDSVTMTVGYMEYGRYDCFVAAVRGCFSASEWTSAFDVGNSTDAYIDHTGKHPEWRDPQVLKGYCVAAGRAVEILDAYIAEHDSPSRKNCILITGHSRGGSVAEIAGAEYERRPDVKSFTYAFSSAAVTNSKDEENCKTVYNIFDSSDFLSSCLPFGNEAFYRYGKTLSADIFSDADIIAAVAAVRGADDYRCMAKGDMEKYSALFARLFPDRDSLYNPVSVTRTFGTEEEASASCEQCREIIGSEHGLGLEQVCSLSDPKGKAEGSYEYIVTYSRAALLFSLGRILAYGEAAGSAAKVLFAEDADMCELSDLIVACAPDITAGHRLLNSYVLAGFVK